MLETCDWQWRNGGVARRAPRVRPAAERVLPPPDLRLLLVRGGRRRSTPSRRYPDNILYETDYPHPTCQHPGPRTPAQRPRDYATRVARRRCPTTCCAKVLHDNAARVYGLLTADRRSTSTRPARPRHRRTSSSHLAGPGPAPAHRPRRAPQRLHPGHVPGPQAGRDLGRRAARARRRLPHRHRRVVRRRRRHVRRDRATRRASPPSGTPPTSSRSATSSAARSSGWRTDQRPRATPAGWSSPLHCDVTIASDRARFRAPELLRGHPRPVPHRPGSPRPSASPAPATCSSPPEIDAAEAGRDGAGRRGRARTTSSTPPSTRSSPQIARTGPAPAPP